MISCRSFRVRISDPERAQRGRSAAQALADGDAACQKRPSEELLLPATAAPTMTPVVRLGGQSPAPSRVKKVQDDFEKPGSKPHSRPPTPAKPLSKSSTPEPMPKKPSTPSMRPPKSPHPPKSPAERAMDYSNAMASSLFAATMSEGESVTPALRQQMRSPQTERPPEQANPKQDL